MVPIGIKNTPPPRPLNAVYTLRAQKDIFANVFVYDRNLERDKLFYIKDIIEYFDKTAKCINLNFDGKGGGG